MRPIHRDFIVRHGIEVVVCGFDTDRCSPRTFDVATWYDVPDEMGIWRNVSVFGDPLVIVK